MNLAEFAALKPGDEVRNDMTHSDGVVASIDNNGVKIAWAGNELTFTYGVQSTAWFHWSLKPKPAYCPNGDKVLCNDPARCKHGTEDAQCLGGDYDAIMRGE